jgi:peroxiredoxin
LQRWEALQSDFDALGIRMVAISPDTVDETALLKRKSGLSMPLLADPDLSVTDLYGLRHPNGFAGTPGKRGIRRPLAIPTTLLIDAEGVVRWIDRADDYRVRSEASRVLGAIRPLLA